MDGVTIFVGAALMRVAFSQWRAVEEEEIPVIDVAAGAAAVRQARRACERFGFFYVCNHGVDAALVAEVLEQSRRFFDLPLDAKMEVVANKYNRGYTTMQDETLDTAGQKCGDTKEGYYIARECGTPVNDLEGPNQWPDESLLPQWRETMMRYHSEMNGLGLHICQLLSEGTGMDAHAFDNYLMRPLATLRLLRYARRVSDPSNGVYGAGAHTDYGFITLLATDDEPGLQVYLRGKWRDVPPKKGCFIVNLGDMFMRLTNDNYKSTLHRVVVKNASRHRFSVAFFYEPSFDAVVSCIPTFCTDCAAKYPPVRYGDYLLDKYKKTSSDFQKAIL